MIVQEIIDRLTANAMPPFRIVAGAADIAAIGEAQPPAMPAAYVLTASEASGENSRATGGLLQRTEVDIAVVIVTGNLSDPRGGAAAAGIESLKSAVRAQLVGWTPASAEDVITHVSGELSRATKGVVWWEDTFATAYYQEA